MRSDAFGHGPVGFSGSMAAISAMRSAVGTGNAAGFAAFSFWIAIVFLISAASSGVMTAMEMHEFAEYYTHERAMKHLREGKVVLFAGGTGHPFFSTDTGTVLRAAEIGADVILLAKNIDGVYSADPAKDPTATKYDEIGYDEVLAKRLGVMDLTATSLAMDNNIPVYVFALKDPKNILRAAAGENVGTLVH